MKQLIVASCVLVALVGCGGGGGAGDPVSEGEDSVSAAMDSGSLGVDARVAPQVAALSAVTLNASVAFSTASVAAPSYSWAMLAAGEQPLVTRGVTVTDANEVVVVGSLNGAGKVNMQPIAAGGGSDDILYVRLDAEGNVKTKRSLGAGGSDIALDVAPASGNGVFMTGQTTGAVNLGASAANPAASVVTQNTTYRSPYVALYSGADQVKWVLSGTGTVAGQGNEVAAAPDGGAVVQGRFVKSLTFGAYTVDTPKGINVGQAFVLRTDASGNAKWLRSVTGNGKAVVRGVAVSAGGVTAISGDFNGSISFSSSPSVAPLALSGSNNADQGEDSAGDCFVARLNADGLPLWAKAIGSMGADKCRAAGFDASGNIYIGGTFSGSVNFGNGISLTSAGAADIFVAKLSPNGTLLWARSMGGSGNDEGAELEVSQSGEVTVSAQGFSGITFPDGQVLNFTGNGRSPFVARFNSDGQFLWLAPSISSADAVNYALARGADDGIIVVGTFSGTMNFSGTTLSSPVPGSYIARLGQVPANVNFNTRTDLDFKAAADYADLTGAKSVVFANRSGLLNEAYFSTAKNPSADPTVPQLIASGTKTFSCALAVAAQDRGLINIDNLASSKIKAWESNAQKSNIKVRDLLAITSGLSPTDSSGSELKNVDSYKEALEAPSQAAPDTAAIYTPNHFQAFLAYFELATGGSYNAQGVIQGGLDPLNYLKETVLNPIGLNVADWERDITYKPNFGGGATLTPVEWIKYGQLLLNRGQWQGTQVLSAAGVQRCLTYQTNAFWGYGLSMWLNRDVGDTYDKKQDTVGKILQNNDWANGGRFAPDAPADVAMAAGTGGYRMYIIPSRNLVAIKFGGGGDPNDSSKSVDNEFLKLLLKTSR